MKKVTIKGPMNDLRIRRSIYFKRSTNMDYPSEFLFSDAEQELWQNSKWLLQKREMISKIERIFIFLEQVLKENRVSYPFPKGTKLQTGNISKGENYQGLPYVVLDFPCYFQKPHVFTLRTIFWWGHYFSCNLVIVGDPLYTYLSHLQRQYNTLKQQEVYYCIHKTPWEHHFKADNMRLIDDLAFEQLKEQSRQNGFIKLARKLPLTDYEQLIPFVLHTYRLFFNDLPR